MPVQLELCDPSYTRQGGIISGSTGSDGSDGALNVTNTITIDMNGNLAFDRLQFEFAYGGQAAAPLRAVPTPVISPSGGSFNDFVVVTLTTRYVHRDVPRLQAFGVGFFLLATDKVPYLHKLFGR